MSGHSKWANIKRQKGAADAQKGKIFTKLGREIAIAVKVGGSADPNANSKLKDVIAKAKAVNMPNDNILRSIKKASGDGDNSNYEEITYEGYGPGGVAVICECTTDNRNRTAGDLRHYFDKFGGNLGQSGCVSYMFNKKGVIVVEKDGKIDEDTLMMEAIEAGAEDFNAEEECYEILTDPADFSAVREALEAKGYEFIEAEVSMLPTTTTKLTDPEQIKFMDKLLENLEELDDVSNVYHSWEQDEEDEEE
jgi:YebC/PmpR family DNA-binding regulatory protein